MQAYPDSVYRRWVEETWTSRREPLLRTNSAFEPMEVRVRCKDGLDRTVIAYAAPLKGASAGTHLAVLFDVTEQRQLEKKILAAASREQHRIGMDLHDGLGQQLTGLSLMLTALAHSTGTKEVSVIEQELTTLATLASDCVATSRAIAHGLSPIALGSGGFERALHLLAKSTEMTSGIEISVKVLGIEDTGLEQAIAEPMFRIVQEALANSAKHSDATLVQIEAQLQEGVLTLTVTDNGRGLTDADPREGLGLSIMRYRARALGGRVEIWSPKTGGTVVRCICRIKLDDDLSAVVTGPQ